MTTEQPLTWHKPTDTARAIGEPDLRDNQIALCTLNAKYIHASLGLRYLYANLGVLKKAAAIHEFTINQRPIDIVEKLLESNPTIIGFGIYIWNITQTEAVMSLIKKIKPETIIVIGGPEVSYEYQSTDAFGFCDYLITGQADFSFRDLCTDLLTNTEPKAKVLAAKPPAVNELLLPYDLYNLSLIHI